MLVKYGMNFSGGRRRRGERMKESIEELDHEVLVAY
jgi:hypothetical protein